MLASCPKFMTDLFWLSSDGFFLSLLFHTKSLKEGCTANILVHQVIMDSFFGSEEALGNP